MAQPSNPIPEAHLSKQEGLDFELLQLIAAEPTLSQREIAVRLGISLGRTNYCLKALQAKGALKIANFRAAKNKMAYIYVLTPSGIAARTALTGRFLQRKLDEYERLKAQIDSLRAALDDKEDT